MAMIKCAECGREISNTAEQCPHCGYQTAQGRSKAEAKGLLVNYVITVVLLIVGGILFFSNIGPFFKYAEYFDSSYFWKYSEEGKKTVFLFALGTSLFVGSIIDVLILKKKAETLNVQDRFEQRAVQNGMTAANVWKCECGRENRAYVYTCACGRKKGSHAVYTQKPTVINERPSIKRWECEHCREDNPASAMFCVKCGEKRRTATAAVIPPQNPAIHKKSYCSGCGSPLEEGGLFCTHCGKKI